MTIFKVNLYFKKDFSAFGRNILPEMSGRQIEKRGPERAKEMSYNKEN